jgi:flagellar motor protein MotB
MLLGLGALGCQDNEKLALDRQNKELQADNTRLRQELGQRPDPSALTQMQQQLADRDQKINDLQAQLRQPPPGQPTDSGFGNISVSRDDRAGTLTINLPGDVLFASGKADLKDSSKSTLNKIVAEVKKDYAGKKVIVCGYTDTDPINKTRDKWEDNLDLSAARARTVAKFLMDGGLEAKEVGMQAYGDTKPKGSKPASRRVEIVVATR